MADAWETVRDIGSDGSVRRFSVPGGWLYQVAQCLTHEHPTREGDPRHYTDGWSAPVFVPDPEVRRG